MAKSRLLLGACIMAGVLFFTSCSENENSSFPAGTSGDIPAQVMEAFNAQFPGASNVVWTTKAGYAVADFYWDGMRSADMSRNHTAWFALESGILGMTEKEIRFVELPDQVKSAFLQVNMDRLRG